MRQKQDILDSFFISKFSDEEIACAILARLKNIRKSCCCSQKEYAELTGLSMATVKRIDSGQLTNMTLDTLIKLLRTINGLENLSNIIPDIPDSPFINEQTKYFKDEYKK